MSHACLEMLVAISSRASASVSFKESGAIGCGYKVEFCQDNESMSSYGVMREG